MANTQMYDPVEAAFRSAIQEFKTSISDKKLFAELLKTKSIEEVYDATDALQEEQAKKGHLRHLAKIEPFLQGAKEYVGVIEVFMQAKPDVIALIWGPLKLLLQWASALKYSFDAIINVTADIGARLPEFAKMARLFHENKRVQDVLVLFFRDILDFYTIALKFFSLSRWKYLFAAVWPQNREKIDLVIKSIERHTVLLRSEVNIEHIQKEYEARSRAFQHYEAAEKAHRLQEFHSIKTDISPRSFSKVLDHLQGRVYRDTGLWLMNNLTFNKWVNSIDFSTQILWLYGIPGAGKTFLSYAITALIKQKGKVLSVFLSHQDAQKSTALNVVQSLIFQLTSKDENLQDVLRQSNVQELREDLESATELFCTLINCVGHTYIVVDGIDEIDGIECRRLLESLIKVPESCETARILFSSRAEDTIGRKLKLVPSLRVDENNYDIIDSFVKSRSDEWMQERKLSDDTRREFKSLLEPLASKSKGMFLYASIVLNNITLLDDLDEVRCELKVLPERLDDVYMRVLRRINNLEPQTLKCKAQKILGWTACSPTPLTIQELEQALIVSPDDVEGSKQVSAPLNAVKICGPIIEVFDEYVLLVHFTFKQYLLSPKIDGHIKPANAILSLTVCCLTYLCQKHHDTEKDDKAITSSILSGTYRLYSFAALYWFELTKTYFLLKETGEPCSELIDRLHLLMKSRSSTTRNNESTPLKPSKLQGLQENYSDLYDWLCRIEKFRSSLMERNFRALGNCENDWTSIDPTTLSRHSFRIFELLDSILCKDTQHESCQCQILRENFGPRCFKCPIFGCPYYRHGFESRPLQKSHIQSHKHLWKCVRDDCEFSEREFLTRSMRDRHEKLFHSANNLQSQETTTNSNEEEATEVLFDLIALGQVKAVEKHMKSMELNEKLAQKIYTNTRCIPDDSSIEMIDMLVRCLFDERQLSQEDKLAYLIFLIIASISSPNLSVFQFLVRRKLWTYFSTSSLTRYSDLTWKLLEWKFIPALLLLDQEDFHNEIDQLISEAYFRDAPHSFWSNYFILSAALKERSRAQLLLSWWKAANYAKEASKAGLGRMLLRVVEYSRRPELAEYILDLGADVDFSRNGYGPTALHIAALFSSEPAAELMVLLLQRGADPEKKTEISNKTPSDEKGAKSIYKWTGKTWAQHIEETEEARQKVKTARDGHRLSDYQMQIMLFERQSRRRLEVAKQQHDRMIS